jgi:hypothetical protein
VPQELSKSVSPPGAHSLPALRPEREVAWLAIGCGEGADKILELIDWTTGAEHRVRLRTDLNGVAYIGAGPRVAEHSNYAIDVSL